MSPISLHLSLLPGRYSTCRLAPGAAVPAPPPEGAFFSVTRTVDELRERARVLKSETGLDLGPTVSRLEQSGNLPGGQLLL